MPIQTQLPESPRVNLAPVDFLQKRAARLNYDFFVWLDADKYFVRHPGDVLGVLDGDAIHACLESNLCALDNLRPDWWGCPLPALVKFMRVNGVRHEVTSQMALAQIVLEVRKSWMLATLPLSCSCS